VPAVGTPARGHAPCACVRHASRAGCAGSAWRPRFCAAAAAGAAPAAAAGAPAAAGGSAAPAAATPGPAVGARAGAAAAAGGGLAPCAYSAGRSPSRSHSRSANRPSCGLRGATQPPLGCTACCCLYCGMMCSTASFGPGPLGQRAQWCKVYAALRPAAVSVGGGYARAAARVRQQAGPAARAGAHRVKVDRSPLRLTSVYSAEAMVASGVRPWQWIRPRSSAALPLSACGRELGSGSSGDAVERHYASMLRAGR